MADTNTPDFDSTGDWLLHNITEFLDANTHLKWVDGEAFGWMACGDSSVCERLRLGGSITIKKMDKIIEFLKDPIPPSRWKKDTLNPIVLTRRVYE